MNLNRPQFGQTYAVMGSAREKLKFSVMPPFGFGIGSKLGSANSSGLTSICVPQSPHSFGGVTCTKDEILKMKDETEDEIHLSSLIFHLCQ